MLAASTGEEASVTSTTRSCVEVAARYAYVRPVKKSRATSIALKVALSGGVYMPVFVPSIIRMADGVCSITYVVPFTLSTPTGVPGRVIDSISCNDVHSPSREARAQSPPSARIAGTWVSEVSMAVVEVGYPATLHLTETCASFEQGDISFTLRSE